MLPICKLEAKYTSHDDNDIISTNNPMLHIIDDNYMKSYISEGYGIFIKFNETIYVLSCYHILGRSDIDYCKIIDREICRNFELVEYLSIIPMDTVLLKFKNREEQELIKNYIDVNTYLNDYSNDINTIFIDTLFKKINIKNGELHHSFLKSHLFPKIPLIGINFEDEYDDELCGYSGLPIMNKNNPIGQIIRTGIEFQVDCIYLPFLLKVLQNMIISENKIINCIYIKTDICCVKYLDTTCTAHVVNTESCGFIRGKNEFKFKNENIIIKVDDQHFNENGFISCNNMGLDLLVTLNTYLLLKTLLLNEVEFKMGINNKLKHIKLSGINYNNIFSTRVQSTHKKIVWNGFIFIEFSEELLINYQKKGFRFRGNLIKNIDEYAINKNKRIILYDINHLDVQSKYNKLQFPLCGENGNYFLQLEKIGQKKINDIDELYRILSTYKKMTTFIFKSDNNDKYIKYQI